jgi:hypothetical protein
MNEVELRGLLNAVLEDRDRALQEHAALHNAEIKKLQQSGADPELVSETARQYNTAADIIMAEHRERIDDIVSRMRDLGIDPPKIEY